MIFINEILEFILKKQLKVVRFYGAESTKFTVPADVSRIFVTGVAGGGGAAYDQILGGYSAAGGGSGEYVYRKEIDVNPGEILSIVIGAGGEPATSIGYQGGSTYIQRNGNTIFNLVGGGGSTYPSSEPIGGNPGNWVDGITTNSYAGAGRFGSAFNNIQIRRGRGGSNPLGFSARIAGQGINGVPLSQSVGFGYGGSGIAAGENNQGLIKQAKGGDGALIIEYFTST